MCPNSHRLKTSFKARSRGKFSLALDFPVVCYQGLDRTKHLAESSPKARFDNMRCLSNYRLQNNASVPCLLVVYPFSPVSSLTTFT